MKSEPVAMPISSVVRASRAFLRLRAVRVGAIVLAVSAVAFGASLATDQGKGCELLLNAREFVQLHALAGLVLFFGLSFCVFLTVMPMGTVLALLAGYFLGPVAGLAMFAALMLASLILFELAREENPHRLAEDLAAWPAVAGFAGFARRRGFSFTILSRLVPVVPTAVASLAACLFGVQRRDFLLGSLISGWIRPVAFTFLGSLGRFAPICGIDPAAADFSGILVSFQS